MSMYVAMRLTKFITEILGLQQQLLLLLLLLLVRIFANFAPM